jgi:hypothetical protein
MAEGYERLPTCLADFHDQVGADYYARTNGRLPPVRPTGTDRGVPTGQVGRCGGLTVHLIPKWGGAVLPLVVMGTRPSWRMRASRTSSVTQAAQVVRGVS